MKLKVLLSTLTLALTVLSANLENYFKPVVNKEGNHSIEGIDFIYMVNLDERPEKWESCSAKFHAYNIYPYRFSAVNGWELPLETINAVGTKYTKRMKPLLATYYKSSPQGKAPHEIAQIVSHETTSVVGRTYFCHCMACGPIAIVLSHLSVLQDAYDSGYETIWVLEDDEDLIRDPNEVSYMIQLLDKQVGQDGWDILYTDLNPRNREGVYVSCASYALKPNFTPKNPKAAEENVRITEEFIKRGSRYGAYSMIIRRSGIEKILQFFKKHQLFLPYDMEIPMIPNIRLYTVSQDIVSNQVDALSDNGRPGYKTPSP